MQQDLDGVPGACLRGAADDRARRARAASGCSPVRARPAARGCRAGPPTRRSDAATPSRCATGRGGEAPAQLGEQHRAVGNPSHGIERAQGVCRQRRRRCVACRSLAPHARAQARAEVVDPAVEIAQGAARASVSTRRRPSVSARSRSRARGAVAMPASGPRRDSPRRAATWSFSRTTSSAAADGVGARRSATKSAMVKSVSWPTAEITGTRQPAMARATRSSLNAHRSSMEPPPRPTITTSRSSTDCKSRSARTISPRRLLALHAAPERSAIRRSREAPADDVQHVADRGARWARSRCRSRAGTTGAGASARPRRAPRPPAARLSCSKASWSAPTPLGSSSSTTNWYSPRGDVHVEPAEGQHLHAVLGLEARRGGPRAAEEHARELARCRPSG